MGILSSRVARAERLLAKLNATVPDATLIVVHGGLQDGVDWVRAGKLPDETTRDVKRRLLQGVGRGGVAIVGGLLED